MAQIAFCVERKAVLKDPKLFNMLTMADKVALLKQVRTRVRTRVRFIFSKVNSELIHVLADRV